MPRILPVATDPKRSKKRFASDPLQFKLTHYPHVISALREKRALVAGLIEKLERKLEQHRADLTHIDGVLRLFQPDRDPGDIDGNTP